MAPLTKAQITQRVKARPGEPTAREEQSRAVARTFAERLDAAAGAVAEQIAAAACGATASMPRWMSREPELMPRDPLIMVAGLPLLVEVVEKPVTKNKGGRPATAVPVPIQAKVAAWLAAEGCPETLVEVERKIHNLLAEVGREAAKSTVREYARPLFDEYRQALREGR